MLPQEVAPVPCQPRGPLLLQGHMHCAASQRQERDPRPLQRAPCRESQRKAWRCPSWPFSAESLCTRRLRPGSGVQVQTPELVKKGSPRSGRPAGHPALAAPGRTPGSALGCKEVACPLTGLRGPVTTPGHGRMLLNADHRPLLSAPLTSPRLPLPSLTEGLPVNRGSCTQCTAQRLQSDLAPGLCPS